MIDAVITRLKAQTTLRAVEGAASLNRLMQSRTVPQGTHAAYVVPLGMQGGPENAAAVVFTQTVVESVGVILIRNAWGDRTGKSATDELREDIDAVIAAIVGWAPEPGPGVFRLVRGQLVGAENSAVVFQLDFGISTQLRIKP